MINSMTGYGSASINIEELRFTVNIRSVNSRYLDLNLRLPSVLYSYENELKKIIKRRLNRGKLDVYIRYQGNVEQDIKVDLNESLLLEYLNKAEYISSEYYIENNLKLSHFINNKDIFILDQDENEDKKEVFLDGASKALEESISKLIEARKTEGTELYLDIQKKALIIEDKLQEIKTRTEAYDNDLKKFYFSKVEALSENFKVDKDRLYTEVALLIDKACIDEEMVRLSSHIKQLRDTLDMDMPVGKKLDFLVQEMNREANTILSKSKSVDLTSLALEIKTEVEKIREQIQNIE